MTDHRRKSKRVLRRDRPRKPRRPPIPAPKIILDKRARIYDELETVYDEADAVLLDPEFDA